MSPKSVVPINRCESEQKVWNIYFNGRPHFFHTYIFSKTNLEEIGSFKYPPDGGVTSSRILTEKRFGKERTLSRHLCLLWKRNNLLKILLCYPKIPGCTPFEHHCINQNWRRVLLKRYSFHINSVQQSPYCFLNLVCFWLSLPSIGYYLLAHLQGCFVRFEPSFFFFKCLLKFNSQLKSLKLKGTR